MQKKKAPYMQRKAKDEPNKKLIAWIGSIFAVIIIVMAVLLITNQ